jgi:NAD(P)-dependent dehydrogenase (short-subunit alcohol dehydrogenase family)
MAGRVLVTGAGGFIGHHMVKYLVDRDYWVRGADIRPPKFETSPAHEFEFQDLRQAEACHAVARDVRQIYHLAADLAIGHVTADRAKVLRNNTLMDVNILEAARLKTSSIFCLPPPPVSIRSIFKDSSRGHCARTMLGRLIPKRGRACISSTWRSFANIALKISGWRRESYGSITSTALWADTKEGARRHRRRSAGKLLSPTPVA